MIVFGSGMTSILLGALLLAQASVSDTAAPPTAMREPVSTMVTTEVTHSLTIPDELVPAVMPYVMCVEGNGGVPIYNDGKLVEITSKPEDCPRLRSAALKNGVKLLRQQKIGRNDDDRRSRVEHFFADFDEYRAKSQLPPESLPTDGPVRREGFMPAAIDVRWPDQIDDLVMKYQACLMPTGSLNSDDFSSFTAKTQDDAARCKPLKIQLTETATTRWPRQPRGNGIDDEASQLFDKLEALHMMTGGQLDKLSASRSRKSD